jgi:hypothetical protein
VDATPAVTIHQIALDDGAGTGAQLRVDDDPIAVAMFEWVNDSLTVIVNYRVLVTIDIVVDPVILNEAVRAGVVIVLDVSQK